eukprot:Clim_evm17s13 gene=Clim_evmTU17s13
MSTATRPANSRRLTRDKLSEDDLEIPPLGDPPSSGSPGGHGKSDSSGHDSSKSVFKGLRRRAETLISGNSKDKDRFAQEGEMEGSGTVSQTNSGGILGIMSHRRDKSSDGSQEHDGRNFNASLSDKARPSAGSDGSSGLEENGSQSGYPNRDARVHTFVTDSSATGNCQVCAKSLHSAKQLFLNRSILRCQLCDVVVHENCRNSLGRCLQRPGAYETLDSGRYIKRPTSGGVRGSQSDEDSALHGTLVEVQAEKPQYNTSARVTKTSIYLIQHRFEVELANPSLKDPLYIKAIKAFKEDFLTQAWKYVNANSRDRHFVVKYFEQVFKKTLINSVTTSKGKESGLKELLSSDSGSQVSKTAADSGDDADGGARANGKSSRNQPSEETKQRVRDAYHHFRNCFHDYTYYGALDVEFDRFVAKDVAQQFTVTDSRLFVAIREQEYRNAWWTKKDKYERAPNIMAFIGRFNEITLFVMTKVLERPNAKDRARIIEHWIQIAIECGGLQNFNSMKAIVAGLQSSPVHRLKKTWPLVSAKAKANLDRIAEQLSEDQNSAKLRELVSEAKPPIIPFLGMFLTDIVYVYTALAGKEEECKKKIDVIVNQILHMQSIPFYVEPIFALNNYLDNLWFEDEDSAWQLSLQQEPKMNAQDVKKQQIVEKEERGVLDEGELLRTASLAQVEDLLSQHQTRIEILHNEINQLKGTQGPYAKKRFDAKSEELWQALQTVTGLKRVARKLQNEEEAGQKNSRRESLQRRFSESENGDGESQRSTGTESLRLSKPDINTIPASPDTVTGVRESPGTPSTPPARMGGGAPYPSPGGNSQNQEQAKALADAASGWVKHRRSSSVDHGTSSRSRAATLNSSSGVPKIGAGMRSAFADSGPSSLQNSFRGNSAAGAGEGGPAPTGSETSIAEDEHENDYDGNDEGFAIGGQSIGTRRVVDGWQGQHRMSDEEQSAATQWQAKTARMPPMPRPPIAARPHTAYASDGGGNYGTSGAVAPVRPRRNVSASPQRSPSADSSELYNNPISSMKPRHGRSATVSHRPLTSSMSVDSTNEVPVDLGALRTGKATPVIPPRPVISQQASASGRAYAAANAQRPAFPNEQEFSDGWIDDEDWAQALALADNEHQIRRALDLADNMYRLCNEMSEPEAATLQQMANEQASLLQAVVQAMSRGRESQQHG